MMTMKEYFDKYLWCGKLSSIEDKTGCGSNDWKVFTFKAYPPFIKEVICNNCGAHYIVVVRDLAPAGKVCIERCVVDRIRKLAERRLRRG